ncbi:hypothetical protein E1B28_000828 [Marasmius oreades]|uniref:OPT oligopeptide transporter n=1 Tax=Marasmius oreades TaxID=181124 RepID=A0A9P8AEW9_9AGAR|nr:uncharacterized protein E1B28_000828 [Marasmius oreades]KAG7098938.1 hypothetical protein E1B28_000828 [Marasmius oreades]
MGFTTTSVTTFPSHLPRLRRIPDVPEDIDYVMDHLNDPNLDLKKPLLSTESLELESKKAGQLQYAPSDLDTESNIDTVSYTRAESRNSAAVDFDDESPYPEVRAAVPSIDDPTMPVNTFRMWFLGIVFSILVAGLNTLFNFRYPSVYISSVVVQLITLPLGKLFEHVLPTIQFNTFGYRWSLNPGPFNIKEHACITVMSSIVGNGAAGSDVFFGQQMFYGQQMTFAYQITLALGIQIAGYSMAGFLRQFVVWPSSMIWPGALVTSALFNTLHKNYSKRERGHMTRERFFLIVVICSFAYHWLPSYLFTALSMFNWVCWIAPENVVVNALFGTATGLGMGIFTFDWAMISYFASPLVSPWWSQLNVIVSAFFWFWVIVPIVYFTNSFNTGFLPISAPISFDRFGLPYNVTAVITDGKLDLEKYRGYSSMFLPATLIFAYALAFGSITAVLVHTVLWFRKDIGRRLRSSLKDERDVHSRLMQAYPEAPLWWYGALGAVSLVFLLIGIHLFPTELPVWACFIALAIAAILALPMSILQALTNQRISNMQVLYELIAGYMFPNRPIANGIFKVIAYTGTNQGVAFAGDLKLGHYMKVPPRMMFMIQVVATTISCFVVIGVQNWALVNIEDICTPHQKNGFTCPAQNLFGTATVIWGAVGPQRMFSPGQPYNFTLWFLLIGAVLPIPFYFLARRYPLSIWRYVNIPLMFIGVGAFPPATGINYASWALVGFIFNFVIRRRHFKWWMRYNFILSAGLDAGLALCLIVIFFCISLPTNKQVVWIGNTIMQNTADFMGLPFKMPPETGFGPSSW